jgi:hypothetical protein
MDQKRQSKTMSRFETGLPVIVGAITEQNKQEEVLRLAEDSSAKPACARSGAVIERRR